MSGNPSPRWIPLGFLMVLVVALWSPQAFSQVSADTFCPVGDGHAAVPPEGTERAYFDLAPVDVRTRLTPAGTSQTVEAQKVGVHHTFAQPGHLNVTVEVANLGTAEARAGTTTDVRVRITTIGGGTQTAVLPIVVPTRLENRTVFANFAVGAGHHHIQVDVNPNHAPAETCTDRAPRSACADDAGVPQACTETYYTNNRRTDGLLVATFADVVVRSIQATAPARATQGATDAAKATVTVELENRGALTAFNLSALQPADGTVDAELRVVGCACAPQRLTFPPLAPGAVRSVQTTVNLMGIASSFRVEALADPAQWIVERDEKNNARNETFPIPTANLRPRLIIELPREGETYLVPQGLDLAFRVEVINDGDAVASSSSGGAPRLRVQRDNGARVVHDERFTVPANSSRSVLVVEDAANLTGTHTFTVLVDHANEVLEAREDDNAVTFRVAVATYNPLVSMEPGAANTTVPPGVSGRVPFELKNGGSVRDTFTFLTDDDTHVTGTDGSAVTQVSLARDAVFKGQLERDVPADAPKGTSIDTTLRVRSAGSGAVVSRDVTLVVGDDTVAPSITIEDPATGYLKGDKVVLRLVDNVAVASAEADVTGTYRPLTPDAPGSTLYTLDVSGRPAQFRLKVRATDTAGNVAEQTFSLVRDTTAPRIAGITFTPAGDVQPGDVMNVIVEARDDNLDRVTILITQPRPGGAFMENHTLPRQADKHVLRAWTVPDRPGHYLFVVTAHDHAGNNATTVARLIVPGLDVKLVSNVPVASPRAPEEGQRVILRYVVENTNPTFETGEFNIGFTLDFQRQIGLTRVNLLPGERKFVDFAWVATPGPHSFSVALDTSQEVAEDNEPDLSDPNNKPGNNVQHADTSLIFGANHPLFQEAAEENTVPGIGARLAQHWYLPTLFVAAAGLFGVAFWLGRRPVG